MVQRSNQCYEGYNLNVANLANPHIALRWGR